MAHSEEYSIKDLIDHILEDTGYEEELQEEGEIEAQTRLENIEELINKQLPMKKTVNILHWMNFWNRWHWLRTLTM